MVANKTCSDSLSTSHLDLCSVLILLLLLIIVGCISSHSHSHSIPFPRCIWWWAWNRNAMKWNEMQRGEEYSGHKNKDRQWHRSIARKLNLKQKEDVGRPTVMWWGTYHRAAGWGADASRSKLSWIMAGDFPRFVSDLRRCSLLLDDPEIVMIYNGHCNPLQIAHHITSHHIRLDLRRGVSVNHRSMSSDKWLWSDTRSANSHALCPITTLHWNPRTSSWATILNQNNTQIPTTSSLQNGCHTESAATEENWKCNQINLELHLHPRRPRVHAQLAASGYRHVHCLKCVCFIVAIMYSTQSKSV